jgi:hypothetical protein
MKTTILKIFTLFVLIEMFLLFNSFDTLKIDDQVLVLDSKTSILPIIDNFEIPEKSFVRTLKVRYKDQNTKVKVTDSTYYRCAYETKMIFYSSFDTLEMNSLSKQSCEIVAFFNLGKKDITWMLNNHVYFVKIKNMNTKYELVLENPKPRFFTNTLLKYHKIKD